MMRKIIKFLFLCVLFVIGLLVLASFLITRPKVQTFVVSKITAAWEKQTDSQLEVGFVNIKLLKKLSLEDVIVIDQSHDTLLIMDQLDIGINNINPFKQRYFISSLEVEHVVLNANKKSPDGEFNFQYILDAFAPKKEKEKTFLPNFKINQITLSNFQFNYDEDYRQASQRGQFKQLKIRTKEINLPNQIIAIDEVLMDNPEIKIINGEIVERLDKLDADQVKKSFPELFNTGWNIRINRFDINDGNLVIKPFDELYSEEFFQPHNISLQNLELHLNSIIFDTSAYVEIENISFKEGMKTEVKKFETTIKVQQKNAQLSKTSITVNNSNINFDMGFNYESLAMAVEDIASIYLNGNIDINELKKEDIVYFYPKAGDFFQDLKISGDFSGTLGNIKAKNLRLSVLKKTNLHADASIRGLPDIKSALISFNIRSLNSNSDDIQKLVPQVELPKDFKKLGSVHFEGEFYGLINDFVAFGSLQTGLGRITSDIKLTMENNNARYSGKFAARSLDLNKYLEKEIIEKIDFDLTIDGSGLNINDLKSDITGSIPKLTFHGTTYENINVLGKLSDRVFDGSLEIDDDDINLEFNGLLNFRDSLLLVDANLEVHNANLNTMNVLKDTVGMKFYGGVNMVGNKLSNLNGSMNLDSLIVKTPQSGFKLDSTYIRIKSTPDLKDYKITSPNLNGGISGNFDPIALSTEIPRIMSKYSGLLNYETDKEFEPQEFKAEIRIDNDFGLTKFLLDDFEMTSGLDMAFNFNNSSEIFDLSIESDSIVYNKIAVKNFAVTTTILEDFLLNASMDRITINNKTSFNLLSANINSNYDYLNADIKVEDDSSSNYLRLSPQLNKIDEEWIVEIPNSRITLNNKTWTVAEGNKLIIGKEEFIADKFSLVEGNQSIRIVNGTTSLSEAQLEITQLNLYDIGQLIGQSELIKNGFLDGTIKLYEPLKSMEADVDLSIYNFEILNFEADYIGLDAIYNNNLQEIIMAASITDEDYDLTATGFYSLTADADNAADIDITADRIDLNFLEAILKGEIETNAYGRGDLHFKGSIAKPILSGKAEVLSPSDVKIKFLGTEYRIAPGEIVKFEKNIIDLGSVKIFDKFGNIAFAEGELRHNYFKDMTLDVRIITDKFMFLNTSLKNGQSFFGTVLADGVVQFTGLTRNINIYGDVSTELGTDFNIITTSTVDDQTHDFITFIDKSKIKLSDEPEDNYTVDLKGVNLNFNLDINDNANITLFLNSQQDNWIKAKTEGQLNLLLSSTGEMNMYGILALAEGSYRFALLNAFKRDFVLRRGGTITWNGNIMDAEMDLDAVYSTRASLNLVEGYSLSASADVDVIIQLRESLANPDLKFDIVADQSGLSSISGQDELNRFLTEVKKDENKLNAQVFGLLLLNQFLPDDEFIESDNSSFNNVGISTGLDIISDQLSNIFNNAITQISPATKIDIDIDRNDQYNDIIEQTTNSSEFNVSVSQTFLNGRLIFNLGGGVEIYDKDALTTATQSNTGITGEFEVEYLIDQEGRIRVKAYHQRRDNDIFNEDRSRTGIGVLLQKEFETFPELFKRRKNKNSLKIR